MPRTQADEEIQQFLRSAVHDLRAAHRRTSIAAELLSRAADQEARTELEAEISLGLARTGELLTAIGKYAAVLTPIESPAVFPSASAVRFAVGNLDRAIKEAGATVKVGELPEINGDRDRLADVFEQLIGNSLKFRGTDPPLIQIAATAADGFFRFSVTDNGVGIPAKYRDRLFIAFRRLHGADVPGAGLGLAISRKIVESHGGDISIEDAEGPGVAIFFTLPIGNGASRAQKAREDS